MVKKAKRAKRSKKVVVAEPDPEWRHAQGQADLDKAFVNHFRGMVRATPISPNTVIMHLLFDALDRLRV